MSVLQARRVPAGGTIRVCSNMAALLFMSHARDDTRLRFYDRDCFLQAAKTMPPGYAGFAEIIICLGLHTHRHRREKGSSDEGRLRTAVESEPGCPQDNQNQKRLTGLGHRDDFQEFLIGHVSRGGSVYAQA